MRKSSARALNCCRCKWRPARGRSTNKSRSGRPAFFCNSTGPGQPAFNFPSIVGPYNYFDLRASLSQSVADLTRLHNYRSSKETARASGMTVLDSRELIVLAVTGAYLQVIASQSRVDTARAQISTAQTSYTQAVDRNRSGLNARIDVNRSLVELQTQQQRLNSLLNDLAKQKISLARRLVCRNPRASCSPIPSHSTRQTRCRG